MTLTSPWYVSARELHSGIHRYARRAESWCVLLLQDRFAVSLFSGMPLLECCHVDDMSPENTIVVFPQSWVDTDVCRLYIGFSPPQPGGMRAPSRSPVFWWSERRTDSSMMILHGIWTCHVAKESEPSCFNDTWNWRPAGSLHDRGIGNVSLIANLHNLTHFSRLIINCLFIYYWIVHKVQKRYKDKNLTQTPVNQPMHICIKHAIWFAIILRTVK